MKKLILSAFLGVFLASCQGNKKNISIEVIPEEEIAAEVGCFYSKNQAEYDQFHYIFIDDMETIYMKINGKTEKFKVNRNYTDEELTTEKFSNETYQVEVHQLKSTPTTDETGSINTGKISVKNKKTGDTASVDFYGYCGC